MDLSLKIDQVDHSDITVEEFRKSYLNQSKPLLIKGFAKDFPAGELWTFDYFKQKMGDFEVGIFDNSKKSTSTYVKPDLYMKISKFLDIIQKDEETPYRIFLFNMFKEFPELRKEFPTPPHAKGILGDLGLAFFGGKNTNVRVHFDIDCSSVLMTQFIGRKRVVLISPEYETLFYKLPFSGFSMVDIEKPDYNKFPGLKYVKGYDFVMDPGDALFMPSRYWHYNTYLEGGMAVSYRVIANEPVSVYNGLMNTSFRLMYDKMMGKVLKDKWVEKKIAKAIARADREIQNLLEKDVIPVAEQ